MTAVRNKMINYRKVLLLPVAYIVALGAGGGLVIYGKEWLARWGLSAYSTVYTIGALFFVWLFASLSVRKLIAQLASASAARRNLETEFARSTTDVKDASSTYKYPRRVGALCIVAASFFFAVPFILGWEVQATVAFLVVGMVFLGWGLYLLRYAVILTSASIIIKAFAVKEYPFSSVVGSRVVQAKGYPTLLIKLANGAEVEVGGGMLVNFSALAAIVVGKQSAQQLKGPGSTSGRPH